MNFNHYAGSHVVVNNLFGRQCRQWLWSLLLKIKIHDFAPNICVIVQITYSIGILFHEFSIIYLPSKMVIGLLPHPKRQFYPSENNRHSFYL